MKNFIIFTTVILSVFAEKKHTSNQQFFQHDYHIVPEWFEVVSFDKRYVKEMTSAVHKYNRSVTTLNLTVIFNVDLENDLEMIGQGYKYSSNEYREFPVRMQINFFQAVKQDVAGLSRVSKCGNFNGRSFIKGRKYLICNWTPDESKFPPYFPSGRYMGEIQALYESSEMFVCRAYVAVTRPEL